ncbi:MAG TPA: ester cyclase [Solirubrobacterales bacterium]|nr:ester cyclase [Solirubrobacterales bacterium]
MAAKTEPKPKTAGKLAKAYFGAIADRDLDLAVSLWKPGGRDLIHGIADLKAPHDIKAFFNGLYSAFPDYEFEILELAASGKNAACRWHSTGTFLGPGRFQGLAPTGARIELEGCDMLRVEDGLIVENNAYVNGALIAQQLGLLPQQGSTADRVVTGAFNAKTAALGHLRRLRD